jgi:hypothetical protein
MRAALLLEPHRVEVARDFGATDAVAELQHRLGGLLPAPLDDVLEGRIDPGRVLD